MARRWLLIICLLVATAAARAAEPQADASHLEQARKYVRQSERYLHHSQLKPGMKGYGLTVLDGVEIVRFEAKILSVLSGMAPQRDMILAILQGPDEENFLQTSGIIAGMSGSPVYVKGPDGKDRMIGAVAYGWFAEKKPICGIQPITQMLAVSGLIDKQGPEAGGQASAKAGRARPRQLRELTGKYLAPGKIDFGRLALGPGPETIESKGRIPRLPIPLAMGISDASRRQALSRSLEPMGFLPVPAAGLSAGSARELKDVSLQPGSAISVPLVTGDQDWTAVGTVTDVVDGHVLAFGHSFFGEGKSSFPMGPAYVHTVIPTFNSFKIGSTIRITGATYRDESVAVVGRQDLRCEMIPMTLRYRDDSIDREQTFRYRIVKDPSFSGMLSFALVSESFVSYTAPPEHHHVLYKVTADYGDFGTYSVENISGSVGPAWAASDLSRAVGALSDNAFAEPRYPRSIEVEVEVREGEISSALEELRLDSSLVQPGQTLTGTLKARPFREEPTSQRVSMQIPEDLPPGKYVLAATGLLEHLALQTRAMPHLYNPENERQLFEAIQRINAPGSQKLYLHLQRPEGGVALGAKALPKIPQSRASILAEASLPDVRTFQSLLTRTMDVDYLPEGNVTAEFTVQKHPDQAPLVGKERK